MMKDSYISYFTPSEMTAETLEFIFVKREKLAARLVALTRESVLTKAKYQNLLIGPRGMGKSHIVALVYHRVKAITELDGKIAIAWLAEEEWGVGSLADFYMVILEALEREYGGLRTRIDAIFDLPDAKRATVAGDLIRTFVGDRTLFLLVENLEEVFKGLSAEELWSFRSFLSDTPFATVLATTPSLFDKLTRQKEAFFGFFQPHYLKELSVEEATELLGKLAERRGDAQLTTFLQTPTAQDRVRAVHELAGGHPRLYLLFAHLLTQSNLDELVTAFLEFLDELTPYFQDRMKGLSPQQRKITTFLCDQRGAAAVKEIVARTNGMTSQTVSSQLDKLEEMGYVQKTRVGRESHYELREPLLRMIVEKKRGRGEPIRLVVDFLRRWYSRDERREHLAHSDDRDALYWHASLDLDRAVHDTPDPSRAEPVSEEFWKAMEQGEYSNAVELAAEIIERKGHACDVEDWDWYAWCLGAVGDIQKSLEWFNKALQLNSRNVITWRLRGDVLYQAKQYEQALESIDQAIQLDSQDANTWGLRAHVLEGLSRFDEALSSSDKATEIAPERDYTWHDRGSMLFRMEHYTEALKSVDKAIALDPNDGFYWHNKGIVLTALAEYDKALASFDKSVELCYDRVCVWFHRAEIYLYQKRWSRFKKSLTTGLDIATTSDIKWRDASIYCRTLLKYNQPDIAEMVTMLVNLYAKYKSVNQLGQGLVTSISTLVDPLVSQERAEAWFEAWKRVGDKHHDLAVPLRLLSAAVAWKPAHDVRALLTIAIEERRILEKILNVEVPAPEPSGS